MNLPVVRKCAGACNPSFANAAIQHLHNKAKGFQALF